MSKKVWIPAILVTIALVFFAIYFEQKKQKDDSIMIGAIFPLTGDAAQWGIPPMNGAQLAIDEINAKDGVAGKQLVLNIEDSRAEPKEGVSAFNKITSVDKAQIVIGPVASSVTLAVAPIAERNHILLISPASTNPKISNAGEYIFRVIPSDALRGQVFAEYMFNEEGIRKVAIIYINNEGGVGNRDSFKERFVSLGGNILMEEGYKQGATDLRTQITKVKASNAEAVMIISYPQDTIILMRQAKELDINKPLYFQTEAVEDSNVLREAGESAEGATYILPASAEGASADAFVKAYEEEYGKKPELFAAEAYDIVYLIAAAIRTDPDSDSYANLVRDYLYNVSDYAGASGIISFNDKGDVVKPMAIKKIVSSTPNIISTK